MRNLMPNNFYTSPNGQNQGSVDDQELRELAVQGISEPTTPLTEAPPDDTFGKVLATDTGQGNASIFTLQAVLLLLAILIGGLFCVALPNEMRERVREHSQYGYYGCPFDKERESHIGIARVSFWMGGYAVVVTVLLAALCSLNISETEITVYENGITGTSFLRHLIQHTYDEITSVEATGTAIVIHASGTWYKCYVTNPAEIKRIIVEQQQKRES